AGPVQNNYYDVPTMRAGPLSSIGILPMKRGTDGHAPTVLIASPNGAGLGQPWDYSQARKLNDKFKVILAGGLNPNNVAQALQRAHPHGVDVSSGVESSKGVKNESMIKDFLQTAKSALQTIENKRETCNKL
ncbi:MAG: hypothetical protein L3J12_04510, partial [Spirochaetales bacterium]|nr:hypothetical protein [Spirochaetales bacterium]